MSLLDIVTFSDYNVLDVIALKRSIFVYIVQKSQFSLTQRWASYRIFLGPVMLDVFKYIPHPHDLDLESPQKLLKDKCIH